MFLGGADGTAPLGKVLFDEAGNLYGTTLGGNGPGTVYKLTPSQGWAESTLYAFSSQSGYFPFDGVTFDNVGNLYGTTSDGGLGYGIVFQLSPSGSEWIENDLHIFQGGSDGGIPWAGLTLDQSGNFYGTTSCGTVFELSLSNGSWTYTLVYNFGDQGCGPGPHGNLILDGAGNLYGTTNTSVFKLIRSDDGWTYTSLHDFTGGSDGSGAYGNLVFDANGNLYGTTLGGGTGSACSDGCGVVFEITP
jgi:uncharacterized repeat protein (TIGR03803 family)